MFPNNHKLDQSRSKMVVLRGLMLNWMMWTHVLNGMMLTLVLTGMMLTLVLNGMKLTLVLNRTVCCGMMLTLLLSWKYNWNRM